MLLHKMTGHTGRKNGSIVLFGIVSALASIFLFSTANATTSDLGFDLHGIGLTQERMLSPRITDYETDFDWKKVRNLEPVSQGLKVAS